MADSTTSVINASSARQSVFYFGSSNVYIELGSKIDLANQSFTIELWDRRMSWGQYSLLGQSNTLHIGYNSEQHLFFQTHGSTLTAPKAYDNDYSWHHWAVTFDHDSKARVIYLNGFPLADDVASQAYTATGNWNLGPNTHTTNRNSGGHMADVRIWNYVRSQEEIQADRFRRLNGDESGLVGYWPLDEGQGDVARDRTSHGNHGKITYPLWRQQLALQSTEPITKLQPTLRLYGYNSSRTSWASIPGFSSGAFPHTVEAWFCPYSSYANYSWLLFVGHTSYCDRSHCWVLNKNAGTLEIGPRTSDKDRLEIPVKEGKWHHIASVFDGKQLSVYVDGLLFPNPLPSTMTIVYGYFFLGQNYTSYNSNNEDGRGRLTEVRLWKGARSQEEIQANLYHRLMGDEKDLAIYWPLNEGYKNTLHDKTSHGNHVTISGTYYWEEQLFLIPAHHDSQKSAQEKAIAHHRQQVTGGGTTTTGTTTGTTAGSSSGTATDGTTGTTTGTSSKAKTNAKVVRPSVLSFDGTDDYVDCGAGIEPTEAITVEAWVKHEDSSGYIVNRGGSEDEDGYSLSWADGKIRVELQNTQSKKKVSCENTAPSDGEWHHIAFTWSRKEKVITTYIDGKSAATTKQFTGTLGVPTQALNIGRNALHDGYFHGQIVDVRIWDQARSQHDIERAMKEQLEGDEDGLIGYWPLDDKGTTVKDRSGNDRNGTVQGATWEEIEKLPVAAHQLWATGLEDYGYWYRWAQNLPQQTDSKPFRRGRIWA